MPEIRNEPDASTERSRTRILRLKGGEGIDLLQRISTGDLSDSSAVHPRSTVFVNDKARCVAVASVLRDEKDVLLAALAVPGVDLAAWIDRFVIMEDVSIVDETDQYSTMLELIGDSAGFQRSHGAEPPVPSLRSIRFPHPLWSGRAMWIIKRQPGSTEYPTAPGAPQTELTRIRLGIPAVGSEITGDVNPFECGLGPLVSLSKGCYIGQEILARLDTYNKVQRRLCRFQWSSDAPFPHAAVICDANGKEAGRITSAVYDPERAMMLGLGILRTNLGPLTGLNIRTDGTTGTEEEIPVEAEFVSADR